MVNGKLVARSNLKILDQLPYIAPNLRQYMVYIQLHGIIQRDSGLRAFFNAEAEGSLPLRSDGRRDCN